MESGRIERDALYDSEAVARMFGVTDAAVRAWIRKGKLKASKLGKRYIIKGSSLLDDLPAATPTLDPK
jgi:excisionase family DNA binding protein